MEHSNKLKDKIYITKPFLPPLEEYTELLEEIWESKQLTNKGPFHEKFEIALKDYLKVKYVSLVNNATTGLIIALKTLGIKGDVITTPFSFIATAHSIKWNGLNPIFIDIDDNSGNLQTIKVEEAITEKTGAILAVHNFGIPGDITGLEKISKKYDIPIIYDSAPCMGVFYKGKSLASFGDMSVLSFHATKVFTTFEGGAIISSALNKKKWIDGIRNFSIESSELVSGIGINGKMNEMQSSLGILQLAYITSVIAERKKIFQKYYVQLVELEQIRLVKLPEDLVYNYAYCPIFFNNGITIRDKVYNKLIEKNYFPRKYWYPLIVNQNIYSNEKSFDLTNAEKLSSSVLCLPLYMGLNEENIEEIIKIINQAIYYK